MNSSTNESDTTHTACDAEPRLACVDCHQAHERQAAAAGLSFAEWVRAQGKRIGGVQS